jgi:hypothetical protein
MVNPVTMDRIWHRVGNVDHDLVQETQPRRPLEECKDRYYALEIDDYTSGLISMMLF